MKQISFTLLLLAFTTTCIFAQFNPKTSGAYNCYQRKSRMQELPMLPSQTNTIGPHSYDVLKYTMNLDIYHCYTSPYPHSFTANIKIQFKADSVINSIKLNASNASLHIDSIKLNASSFTQIGDILTVNLDQTYNPGQIAEILGTSESNVGARLTRARQMLRELMEVKR